LTQSPTIKTQFALELPVSIRHARRADLPSLEWNEEMWGYRELFEQAYEDTLRNRRLILIADIRGYAMGRLFVQLCPGNFYYADGITRGYMYSFSVIPILQGCGIGTRLIEAAEEELVLRGFQWATIAVSVENVRAKQLYERLGYAVFRKDNSHWTYNDPDGRLREVRETCWAMKKRLVNYPLSRRLSLFD
jgi:ribosomal protein S18 acetylase RimI-like enzyme